jgi:hypothetical protein
LLKNDFARTAKGRDYTVPAFAVNSWEEINFTDTAAGPTRDAIKADRRTSGFRSARSFMQRRPHADASDDAVLDPGCRPREAETSRRRA